LPFDAITGTFTEPVVANEIELSLSDAAQGTLALVNDRAGRPRAFEIVPAGTWEPGTTLTATLLSLRDGAGNRADAVLGSFDIPPEPDSTMNAGFEASLESGWLTDPAFEAGGPLQILDSIVLLDDLGMPFTVTAPEGARMLFIPSVAARLIGHFAPTEPAQAVGLRLGVIDPTVEDVRQFPAGFRISVVSGTELSIIGDGRDLPEELPDARGEFAGFVDLTFALPEGSGDDFWLVVEPWGYAPPVHLPSLLVDDVRLL
jgi:hypothetical protein